MAQSKIATAYVQVMPSMEGIKGRLSHAFGAEGDSAGSSFGASLIGKVKGLIATAGIGQAIGKAISSGADLQQSLGGIDTLFKDSADVVKKYANEAFASAGMSANDYMETVTSFSASLISSLGGDTAAAAKAANEALIDMSDNANKMGTDMEMIQNAYQGFAKQNYTMLDNLKLGYGGTKTEMERLLADAQALTGVQYDITNLSDVYSAIHVIQEELGITGATADEAAGTITGSFNAMKASFENVVASLALGESITQPLANLQTTVETFLVGNLFPAIGNVFGALPEVLSAGLSMAIQGLNLAAENADTVIENGTQLMESLITTIIDAFPELLTAGIDLVSNLSTGLVNNLPHLLGTVVTLLGELLMTIASNFPDILELGAQLIVQFGAGILSMISAAGESMANVIVEVVNTVTSTDWLSVGADIIGGIADGIWNGISSITSAAWDAACAALDSAKSALGIASPSKVMRDQVGKFIPAGIAVGIEANTKPLTDAMHGLSDLTTQTMQAELKMDTAAPAVPAAAAESADSLAVRKMGELVDAVRRLQIILDTGTLVGELVDPMDDAIAQKLALVERGV